MRCLKIKTMRGRIKRPITGTGKKPTQERCNTPPMEAASSAVLCFEITGFVTDRQPKLREKFYVWMKVVPG